VSLSLSLEDFRSHLALKGLDHKPVVLKLSILHGYGFVKLL